MSSNWTIRRISAKGLCFALSCMTALGGEWWMVSGTIVAFLFCRANNFLFLLQALFEITPVLEGVCCVLACSCYGVIDTATGNLPCRRRKLAGWRIRRQAATKTAKPFNLQVLQIQIFLWLGPFHGWDSYTCLVVGFWNDREWICHGFGGGYMICLSWCWWVEQLQEYFYILNCTGCNKWGSVNVWWIGKKSTCRLN
jgi:hypothetical protein